MFSTTVGRQLFGPWRREILRELGGFKLLGQKFGDLGEILRVLERYLKPWMGCSWSWWDAQNKGP